MVTLAECRPLTTAYCKNVAIHSVRLEMLRLEMLRLEISRVEALIEIIN